MIKPNITGLSLESYLKMRLDQLLARKHSIEVYNENYLPEWGNKRYSEEDLRQIKSDIAECSFLINSLKDYHEQINH